MTTSGTLRASVCASGSTVRITAGEDTIQIEADERMPPALRTHDFVAWLLLPVAMRRNLDLHVEGLGSAATVRNAQRMAEIWSSWMPGRFWPIKVSFSGNHVADTTQPAHGDLCLYSGGVDATYALLKRVRAGQQQHLLTIHGQDYRYAEGERFATLIRNTSSFASLAGIERLIVRTDVRELYRKYKINVKKGPEVGHGFILAGISFVYAGNFARAVVAADYRLDQQFVVHPWGTNAATNPLFDDGRFRLHTECEDVTRAEKMPLLATCPQALESLSFCFDKQGNPDNCGRCKKCVRTKAGFIAATGQLPKIFLDDSLVFDRLSEENRAFLFDIFMTARRNGTAHLIPGLTAMYEAAMAPPTAWQRLKTKMLR